MLEDYIVNISLPIKNTSTTSSTPNFVLGATFGYNRHEISEEPIWYWDGQDVWLPESNSEILAMFKGTLKFVASGEDLGIGSEDPLPEDTPFPAIGDTLILQLWPQDYIKLKELLPEGSQIPKYIIYQNVDRDSAKKQALALIIEHPEYKDHYKKIFTLEEDGEGITEEEFKSRAEVWINDNWLHGNGIGILVNSGDHLGEVAKVPVEPDGISEEIRVDHFTPDGVDTTSSLRLTLKVQADDYLNYSIAFLIYLMDKIENEQLIKTWIDSIFVNECLDQVSSRIKFKSSMNTQIETDFDIERDEDPPVSLPDLIFQIRHENERKKIPILHDPFETIGSWRVQGLLLEGNYSGSHLPHSLFGQQVEAEYDFEIERVTIGEEEYFRIVDGDNFDLTVRPHHWLTFNNVPTPSGPRNRKRFILGVNMETFRQSHYHDLGFNDIMYDYRMNNTTGQEEPYLKYDSSAAENRLNLLRQDLRAIRDLGASAIRVWVFEYFEGLRFDFTKPRENSRGQTIDSLLMDARKRADRSIHNDLHCRIFPNWNNKVGANIGPGPNQVRVKTETVHVCTEEEFAEISRDWVLEVVPEDDNPLLVKLIENARVLQREAGRLGLKILWTLWVHYGETKPRVSKYNLLYYSHDLPSVNGLKHPPRNGNDGRINVNAWSNFYSATTSSSSGSGRLPIEAWIYKSLMVDNAFRSSFIENAIKPFVRAMERIDADATLGYDLMNEPDIVWTDCQHSWANNIKGENISSHTTMGRSVYNSQDVLLWGTKINHRTDNVNMWDVNRRSLPTNWKLTRQQIRKFLFDCKEEVRLSIIAIHSHNNEGEKLIVCGVLGQYDDLTEQEMSLIENGSVEGNSFELSASGITRYSKPEYWVPYGSITSNEHRNGNSITINRGVINLGITDSNTDWLKTHNNACIFLEAGDLQRKYDIQQGNRIYYSEAELVDRQKRAVQNILNISIRHGYAGVFIWHYNNPERTIEDHENNPLTAATTSAASQISFRLAANEITSFKNRHGHRILGNHRSTSTSRNRP